MRMCVSVDGVSGSVFYYFGRIAGNNGIWRNILDYDRTCGDYCVVANRNIPNAGHVYSEIHIIPDPRTFIMSVFALNSEGGQMAEYTSFANRFSRDMRSCRMLEINAPPVMCSQSDAMVRVASGLHILLRMLEWLFIR